MECLNFRSGSPNVGLGLGGGIVLCAVGANHKPKHAAEFGVVGSALSILSLFGAFGGLLVGLILGVVGGGLCVALKPS